jgi:hypothetical protein
MVEVEISHENYQVYYDEATATITCQGSFRLRGGPEYQPILDLLMQAANAKPETLTLDVSALEFLNSSGINTLSKFILQVRNHNASAIIIKGSKQYRWQEKSLINFQRLLPTLQLEVQ